MSQCHPESELKAHKTSPKNSLSNNAEQLLKHMKPHNQWKSGIETCARHTRRRLSPLHLSMVVSPCGPKVLGSHWDTSCLEVGLGDVKVWAEIHDPDLTGIPK